MDAKKRILRSTYLKQPFRTIILCREQADKGQGLLGRELTEEDTIARQGLNQDNRDSERGQSPKKANTENLEARTEPGQYSKA